MYTAAGAKRAMPRSKMKKYLGRVSRVGFVQVVFYLKN